MHTIPYYSILCHTIPDYVILFHTMPYYSILFHTMPYYAILFHTMPYYSINRDTPTQQLEKIHGVHDVLLQFKEIFFCFECHNRVRELFSFFGKYSKTFLQLDSQKNIVKHIENLEQHLLKKIIGDDLSITAIALKN